MTDIFFSYSRQDLDCARRLTAALEKLDRDVWVDLDDLYAGEEFWPEICAAIEGADVFCFIISPDALASRFCLRELEHALGHHKRVLPLLHREPPADELPEVLATRQWIFCRKTDDFDRAVATLAETMDTDPEWRRAHSRLLLRAREWEASRHDRALLLRGVDLERAEAWLGEAGGREEPTPTPLQVDYISVSRQEQDRSFSRELAGTAAFTADQDAELGVLLALEAARVQPTDDASFALRRSLAVLIDSGVRLILRGAEAGIVAAELSPDGERILTAEADGGARVWETASGDCLCELRGHSDSLTTAHFSPDGHQVLTASADGTARLWDAASGEPGAVLTGHGEIVLSARFDADGTRVVTASADKTARIGASLGSPASRRHRHDRGSQLFSGARRPLGPGRAGGFQPRWRSAGHRRPGSQRPPLGHGVRRALEGASRPSGRAHRRLLQPRRDPGADLEPGRHGPPVGRRPGTAGGRVPVDRLRLQPRRPVPRHGGRGRQGDRLRRRERPGAPRAGRPRRHDLGPSLQPRRCEDRHRRTRPVGAALGRAIGRDPPHLEASCGRRARRCLRLGGRAPPRHQRPSRQAGGRRGRADDAGLGRGERRDAPGAGRSRRCRPRRLVQPRRPADSDPRRRCHGSALGRGERSLPGRPRGARGRGGECPLQSRRPLCGDRRPRPHAALVGRRNRRAPRRAPRPQRQGLRRGVQRRRPQACDRLGRLHGPHLGGGVGREPGRAARSSGSGHLGDLRSRGRTGAHLEPRRHCPRLGRADRPDREVLAFDSPLHRVKLAPSRGWIMVSTQFRAYSCPCEVCRPAAEIAEAARWLVNRELTAADRQRFGLA